MEVTLPTVPPHDWTRLYNAACNISLHLPGVTLSVDATTEPTEHGFDVLAASGSVLASVTVLPGEEWEYYRGVWMAAVRDAPHIMATRASDWLGIATLRAGQLVTAEPLQAGDPVGLRAVPGRPELDLTGAVLVDAAPDGWCVQPRQMSSAAAPLLTVPTERLMPVRRALVEWQTPRVKTPAWQELGVARV